MTERSAGDAGFVPEFKRVEQSQYDIDIAGRSVTEETWGYVARHNADKENAGRKVFLTNPRPGDVTARLTFEGVFTEQQKRDVQAAVLATLQ